MNIAITQALLLGFYRYTDLGAAWSNVLAVGLSAIPAFIALRRFVWRRVGKHSLSREIVPFWAYTFVGLAFSTLVVANVEDRWQSAFAVSLANIGAFGLLWVAKFLLLDLWMFTDHRRLERRNTATQ
jgi:putative flippase GtrA